MITSIWILFTIVWPLSRFSRLRDPEVQASYGALYDGIRTSSRIPMLYTAVFCIRRLLLVLVLLKLEDHPVILIYVYLAMFTGNFLYLVHGHAHMD